MGEKEREDRRCTKDDPRIPWLCSCDDCSRAAASAWRGYMDRVFAGEITLGEAQASAVAERKASPLPGELSPSLPTSGRPTENEGM